MQPKRFKVNAFRHGFPSDKEFEIPEFFRFVGETSKAMRDRFLLTRKEVDEFRSVVSDGRFDFGVVVGVLEEKISDEAYNSAERSEHDIIVTTYRKMCPKYQELNR
ncbi:hypothetical protein F8M41_001075 [Gigaspora margarita]|uniref:Uncharacterized protein n=1 Tax=Gigaspora margarita TaxID=4874 RepID=A0A8H3XF01_GIGMA|nr:hypothetical protein F8M41_001075 [Gigaspora margarita]